MSHALEGDRQVEQALLPTHTCFDDAMDLLVEMITVRKVPPAQLRLVHGIGLLADGRRFAHAWVERGPSCYFVGLYQGQRGLCTVVRQDYYQRLRVQERTKYTPWQALRENQRTISYGPWKPAYLALARRVDEGTPGALRTDQF
jgi:hypothetical protein